MRLNDGPRKRTRHKSIVLRIRIIKDPKELAELAAEAERQKQLARL